MRVAVTGGAGFIGANLVRRLLDADVEVAVLDDLSTGSRDNLAGLDVEFHEGTVLENAILDEAFQDAQAIVHLAARPSVPRSLADPLATHEANATGTVKVLEAARRAGNRHVILASSSSVYGANPTLPKSEDLTPAPVSPYAVSKLATEQYALAYGHSFGLPVLPFRFFNVFGPLQSAGHAYAAVIPAFVHAAIEDRPLPVNGDGGQTRDFTYVGSVVEVIRRAIRDGVTSAAPVNLAFGSRLSLLDVVRALEEELGRELEVEHGPERPGDVRHSQADQARLRQLFPDAEATPFARGLAQTVHWYREHLAAQMRTSSREER